MIKFDKNVHLALKTLEKNGFETYAIGECVRDAIRGILSYDWDMVTTAEIDRIKQIFPDGEVLSGDEVYRIDFTCKTPENEEKTVLAHTEESILDIRHMNSIEEEISKFPFTIDAMADNPEKSFIDPYDGRKDIKNRLIRTVSDEDKLFKEKPILMLSAVRLAAEMGFDLQKSIYNAILSNWRLLLDRDVDYVRSELERLLVSDNAGKGLNMLAGTGLMAVIVGEEVSRKMSSSEMQQFTTLCENIDKTKPLRMRRLGLLYTCFSKKRGLEAIQRLNFDEKTKIHLNDAMTEMINIQFLGNDKDFKRYIFEHGIERYNYLHNLNKAQRIVYDYPATKIEARNYMMKNIKNKNEPIFVEDLVINSNDIMEAGIADNRERAEEILDMVIAPVHSDARNNERNYLLKMAKKYSKSKISAKSRYVKWLK